MKLYIVSAPAKHVVKAYADWKKIGDACQQTVVHDGWTLPSLQFKHLFEAHAAALDLAMISGSVKPLHQHGILITEIDSDSKELAS